MVLIQTNTTLRDKSIALEGEVEFFASGRYHLFVKSTTNLFVFGSNIHNQLGVLEFDVEEAQKVLERLKQRHYQKKNDKGFLKPNYTNDAEVKRKELERLEDYFNSSQQMYASSDEDLSPEVEDGDEETVGRKKRNNQSDNRTFSEDSQSGIDKENDLFHSTFDLYKDIGKDTTRHHSYIHDATSNRESSSDDSSVSGSDSKDFSDFEMDERDIQSMDEIESPLSLDDFTDDQSQEDNASAAFHFKALTPWEGSLEPESITNIVCGGYHSVFVVDNGAKVYVCGNNAHYQCGLDHCNPLKDLVRLSAIRYPVKLVACGEFHSIFCTYRDEIAVCGITGLGDLPDANRLTFIKYAWLEGKKVRNIAAGGGFSLILFENGELYGFGISGQGQLGLPKNRVAVPTRIHLGDNLIPRAIGCGFDFSLVLAEHSKTKRINMYGSGNMGQFIGDRFHASSNFAVDFAQFNENTHFPEAASGVEAAYGALSSQDNGEGVAPSPHDDSFSHNHECLTSHNPDALSTPLINRFIAKNAEYPSTYFGDESPIPRRDFNVHSPAFGLLSPIAQPTHRGASNHIISRNLFQSPVKGEKRTNFRSFQLINIPLSIEERLVDVQCGENLFVVETSRRLIPFGNGFATQDGVSITFGIPLPLNNRIKQYGSMDNSILRIEAEKDWKVPTDINAFRLQHPATCDVEIEFACFDLEIKKFTRSNYITLPVTSTIPSLLSPTTERMIKDANKASKKKKKGKKTAKKTSKKDKSPKKVRKSKK